MAVFLLLGCTIACNRPPASPPATLRLLELFNNAEVDWPDELEIPKALRKGQRYDPKGSGRRARVTLSQPGEARNNDRRWSLLAPTGSRYRFSLKLPRRSLLRLSLGAYRTPDAAPQRLRFIVRAITGAQTSVELLNRQRSTSATQWEEFELDLSSLGDENIELQLETQALDGSQVVWGAWAVPEIEPLGVVEQGWDVILISLDTLRADHLGCYGYARPTSPTIDAFADRSVRFATAVSQSPWTRPSHKALFRGLYPNSRGGLQTPYLADVLWQAGYSTTALTGGGQVDAAFGFERGFDVYGVHDWIRHPEVIRQWHRTTVRRKRFLFLHTYEIHDPYSSRSFADDLPVGRFPKDFRKVFWANHRKDLTSVEKAQALALYDGDIRFTDTALGKLFSFFEAAGIFDSSIIILTSDHGEQFWEHGTWGHGQNLYDHQLLVPLIIHLPPGLARELGSSPESTPRVIQQQVRLIDIYPTLFELLQVPLKKIGQGQSLVPLLRGETMHEPLAFAENTNIRKYKRQALRSPQFKFIQSKYRRPRTAADAQRVFEELYDLQKDPGEQENVVERLPDVQAQLRLQMDRILASGSTPDAAPDEIDAELRRQLEALGYLGN